MTEHPPLKMDEIMKELFSVSETLLFQLLSKWFANPFEGATIRIENNEFINEETYEKSYTDWLAQIRATDGITQYVHVEFQTEDDASMAFRMFRYGLQQAQSVASRRKPTVLIFPAQRMLLIEESENVPDVLQLALQMPEGRELKYEVPVIKYWEYTTKELVENKMYPLLPLSVFRYRKQLKKVLQEGHQVDALFEELHEEMQQLLHFFRDLYEREEILVGDLQKMVNAITHLGGYLYGKYEPYQTIERKMIQMAKDLLDPLVVQRAIEEGMEKGMEKGEERKALEVACNMLKDGMEITKIARLTSLSEQQVEELRKALN